MDNPETLPTLCTKDTGRRQKKNHNTTQKTKKMSNTDPTKYQEWTQALTNPSCYPYGDINRFINRWTKLIFVEGRVSGIPFFLQSVNF